MSSSVNEPIIALPFEDEAVDGNLNLTLGISSTVSSLGQTIDPISPSETISPEMSMVALASAP